MSYRRNTQIVESVENPGSYRGTDEGRFKFSANFVLGLIHRAWEEGVGFEDLADGFGRGLGTMGGDWSGIRDSSDEAKLAMLNRTLDRLHAVNPGEAIVPVSLLGELAKDVPGYWIKQRAADLLRERGVDLDQKPSRAVSR